MRIIVAKVGGKCDIIHFGATHPALLRVLPCLLTKRRLGEDPCIEESEAVVLDFSLKEYWRPKYGRVGCGRQDLCRVTAFDSK